MERQDRAGSIKSALPYPPGLSNAMQCTDKTILRIKQRQPRLGTKCLALKVHHVSICLRIVVICLYIYLNLKGYTRLFGCKQNVLPRFA